MQGLEGVYSMVIFGMIACSILLALLLKWANRFIKLEFMAIWLFTSLLANYYIGSVSDVQGLIRKNEDGLYLAFLTGQLILLPLSVLFFLNLFHRLTGWAAKVALFLLWVVLMASGERMLEQLGIFRYVNYPLWLSVSFWLSLLMLALGANQLLHHLLSRRDPYV